MEWKYEAEPIISLEYIDEVTSLLFRFLNVNPLQLKVIKDNAIEKIDLHLQQMREPKSNMKSNTIKDICLETKKRLDKRQQEFLSVSGELVEIDPSELFADQVVDGLESSEPRESPETRETKKTPSNPSTYSGQWLENISMLLPEDPEVMKILPYILSCYIISARQNHIDPAMSTKKNIGYSAAWAILNPDILLSEDQLAIKKSAAGRPDRARNSIIHFLLLPNDYKCNAFPYKTGMKLYSTRKYRRKRENIAPLRLSEAKKQALNCWEQYRLFACFCEVCKDKISNDVNITLSMALFSTLWDRSCACYTFCTQNHRCNKMPINRNTCNSIISVLPLLKQHTASEVMNDKSREMILKCFSTKRTDSIERHLKYLNDM